MHHNPVERLYHGLRTDVLRAMRQAFEMDRADADNARDPDQTRAFCDDRLRLIARVLAARGELAAQSDES